MTNSPERYNWSNSLRRVANSSMRWSKRSSPFQTLTTWDSAKRPRQALVWCLSWPKCSVMMYGRCCWSMSSRIIVNSKSTSKAARVAFYLRSCSLQWTRPNCDTFTIAGSAGDWKNCSCMTLVSLPRIGIKTLVTIEVDNQIRIECVRNLYFYWTQKTFVSIDVDN